MYIRALVTVLAFVIVFPLSVTAEPLPYKTQEWQNTIPSSLEETYEALSEMLLPKDIAAIKKGGESVIDTYCFDLERSIKNMWLHQNGSPLVEYFNRNAITDHDRMVRIIVNSFHHHLNGRKIKIAE